MSKRSRLGRLVGTVRADLRSFVLRQASWMLAGTAVQAVVAFGANLVLVRLFSPEDFGRYVIVLSNVGLVQAIVSLRIPILVIRLSKEELQHNGTALYWTALALESAVVLVASGALLHLTGMLDLAAIILLAGMLCNPWVDTQIGLFERGFNYRRLAAVETGAWVATHVLSVMGALAGLGPIVLYVRSWLVPIAQVLGLAHIHAWQPVQARWPAKSDLRSLVGAVRGLWADGMLEQAYDRIMILALGQLGGERPAGFFMQAKRLALLPHQLLHPLASRVAYNYFSSRVSPTESFPALRQALRRSCAILAVAGILAVLLADPVIPWLFGANWQPVTGIFVAQVGFLATVTPFGTFKMYAMARRRMRLFVLVGRGTLYGGLLLSTVAALALPIHAAVAISLGLSAGHVAALGLLYLIEKRREAVHLAQAPSGAA